MKVPDKIYTTENHHGWYETNEGGDKIEYIRKDTLLEWAKEQLNKYKQMDEDFQGDVFIGNRHAFAEVIAKIESL